MGLETGTYISDLVVTNPTSSDPKSQGDDHLRLVKSTLKNTFPNITGAMTVTHTVLNYTANLTSDAQTQINAEISARQTADNLRGLIAGQTWTGSHDYTGATITVPTATLGDRSNKAATTAFVGNELSAFAPVNNANLTGIPTAPTATAGTNTTQLATTAFVTLTAFSSALPAQAGNAGKFVTTDGTNASWQDVTISLPPFLPSYDFIQGVI